MLYRPNKIKEKYQSTKQKRSQQKNFLEKQKLRLVTLIKQLLMPGGPNKIKEEKKNYQVMKKKYSMKKTISTKQILQKIAREEGRMKKK